VAAPSNKDQLNDFKMWMESFNPVVLGRLTMGRDGGILVGGASAGGLKQTIASQKWRPGEGLLER